MKEILLQITCAREKASSFTPTETCLRANSQRIESSRADSFLKMGPSLRDKLIQIHSLCKEPTKKKIGNIKALFNMDSFKVMAHSVFLKIKVTTIPEGLARDSLTDLEH